MWDGLIIHGGSPDIVWLGVCTWRLWGRVCGWDREHGEGDVVCHADGWARLHPCIVGDDIRPGDIICNVLAELVRGTDDGCV